MIPGRYSHVHQTYARGDSAKGPGGSEGAQEGAAGTHKRSASEAFGAGALRKARCSHARVTFCLTSLPCQEAKLAKDTIRESIEAVVDGAAHWRGCVLEVDWQSVVRAFVSDCFDFTEGEVLDLVPSVKDLYESAARKAAPRGVSGD